MSVITGARAFALPGAAVCLLSSVILMYLTSLKPVASHHLKPPPVAASAVPWKHPPRVPTYDPVQRSLKHLASLGIQIKPKEQWYLGVCAGTKSSGVWLREWIELQIVAGVDHLWLVNDNDPETEDGTAAIMDFYEALGFLTIIPGRMPKKHPGCRPAQRGVTTEHNCAAPKHCAEHVAEQVKWMMFVDTDEFAFPRAGCSLSDYVRSTCDQDAAAIPVRWERFGTNGFTDQPVGLLTENFLSSGGDCSALKDPSYEAQPHCKLDPFSFCGECRHTKVLFNMHCATTDHVGWMHFLANTSEWKAKWGREWENSPGPGTLPFKRTQCHHVPHSTVKRECMTWLQSPAGRRGQYKPACCSAGIGYNHYGTKAAKYYWRKQARRQLDKRGFRTELAKVDLNDFISTSVLKFVRVLRQRMMHAGSPVSVAAQFFEVGLAGSTKGTCFQEPGYSYEPSSHGGRHNVSTRTVELALPEDAQPGEFCCASCWAAKGCEAWTVANGICTLLVPSALAVHSDVGKRNFRRPIPKLVEATRVGVHGALSGTVIRDECYAPAS
ncbi:hypothetical protein DIPPA_23098 [Diplonema papillatum]|nr:hypothetical protein DIPPA_23098 [Diplonema papillatum]